MAFEIFDDREHGEGFVVTVASIPICILAVALRFISTIRSGKSIGVENWLALVGLVTFLIYSCSFLAVLIIMNGKNIHHNGVMLPIDKIKALYKIGYIMMPQSTLNQTATKLSVLFLYRRIFYINRGFMRWVYSVGAILVAWCIVTVFIGLFVCKPVAAAWNPTIPGKCLDSQALLAAGVANSTLDFVMVGMAVWMVVKLKLPVSSRLRLGVLFALGGLSGVIGIVKVASAYGTVGNSPRNGTWYIAEQATSILCSCAPIYRSLLGEFKFFKSICGRRPTKDQTNMQQESSETNLTENHHRKTVDRRSFGTSNSDAPVFSWAEADTTSQFRRDDQQGISYPMKTVQIVQRVEEV
ncbi:hypothetical protein QBC38DRAFT_485025 [Podospora fimiseda]|uniref:Rhodopsin domain-containing protein n=1 Tax=Podospora fimiseda TaxID=252190 RepID=A0AAN7BJF0_9PEZI|nr:hypothetical protein QBC38DRAFT_485025 [Podospora fimiseda]